FRGFARVSGFFPGGETPPSTSGETPDATAIPPTGGERARRAGEGNRFRVRRSLFALALFLIGVASGLHVRAATVSFANPSLISIPTAGAAAPYPSTIAVAGLTGRVTKVTVTLSNLSHSYLSDLDILLVGPGGQQSWLISDVGGAQNATNLTL